jgi:hypothetical protein
MEDGIPLAIPVSFSLSKSSTAGAGTSFVVCSIGLFLYTLFPFLNRPSHTNEKGEDTAECFEQVVDQLTA